MSNSFQKDIKEVLSSINDDDLSTIKNKYNSIYGEDGYDNLLANINSLESHYLVDGSYDSELMNSITSKITKYYETSINDKIKKNEIDLREKESLLETFQSRMIDLVSNYNERIELNGLQNQRKYK